MEKIAFLGLGTMGANIARNLLNRGYPLTVYNRTVERARELQRAGAKVASTPKEAAAGVDVIMMMVSDDAAVEEVVFGKNGVLEGIVAGQVVVDMTTAHPSTSLKEAQAFHARGVGFLDAPVFGSKNESRDAGLWLLIGGKKEIVDRIMPIFKAISATQHHMGENGKGTSMKLVGNLLVAAQLEALGEAMVLAIKAGLRVEDVLGVLAVTDFRSPIFTSTGDALARRDFGPSFYLKLMYKDANLIGKFAEDLRSPIPAAAVTREIIKSAVNKGYGDENASALIRVLEDLGEVEVHYE